MQRETEVLILKAYNVVYGVFTTTAPMSEASRKATEC